LNEIELQSKLILFGQLHERIDSSFQILNPQLRRTEYLLVRSTQKLEEEIGKEKIYRKGKKIKKRENGLIREESMRNL
jgi:hypothetical protein